MPVEKFDKRLIERKVRKGDISRDKLKAHLGGLPDLADELAVVETQLEAVANEEEGEGEEGGDE